MLEMRNNKHLIQFSCWVPLSQLETVFLTLRCGCGMRDLCTEPSSVFNFIICTAQHQARACQVYKWFLSPFPFAPRPEPLSFHGKYLTLTYERSISLVLHNGAPGPIRSSHVTFVHAKLETLAEVGIGYRILSLSRQVCIEALPWTRLSGNRNQFKNRRATKVFKAICYKALNASDFRRESSLSADP